MLGSGCLVIHPPTTSNKDRPSVLVLALIRSDGGGISELGLRGYGGEAMNYSCRRLLGTLSGAWRVSLEPRVEPEGGEAGGGGNTGLDIIRGLTLLFYLS
jgi:hypothetical protein